MAVGIFTSIILKLALIGSPVSEPIDGGLLDPTGGSNPITTDNSPHQHYCIPVPAELSPLGRTQLYDASGMGGPLGIDITAILATGIWPNVRAPFSIQAKVLCNSLYNIVLPQATGAYLGTFVSNENGTFALPNVPILHTQDSDNRLARVFSNQIDRDGCGNVVLWFVFEAKTFVANLDGVDCGVSGVHTGSSGNKDYSTIGGELIHGDPFGSASNSTLVPANASATQAIAQSGGCTLQQSQSENRGSIENFSWLILLLSLLAIHLFIRKRQKFVALH